MKKFKSSIFIYLNRYLSFKSTYIPFELEPGVYPFEKRQIPLEGTKTWEQRINEIKKAKVNFEIDPINIGYDLSKFIKIPNKNAPPLIDNINSFEIDILENGSKDAIMNKYTIAKYFNIYNDLFGYPHYFYSVQYFKLLYTFDDESNICVYSGNLMTPSIAKSTPTVAIDAVDNLYTLVMSSPDEHLESYDKEYVHWIISNIQLKDGIGNSYDTIVPYLQPIPYMGTGFHRYVFTLYHQSNDKIDLKQYKLEQNCILEDRTFKSYDFLKNNEDILTPVGLSFFQSSWDDSVRECFRHELNCLEPIFEYNWPKDKIPPQKEFPEGQILHKYYDEYRDVKDIQEEVLKERLSEVDPFQSIKKLKYPLAVPEDENEMGWVTLRNREKRRRQNQWRHLDIVDE